jgi:hypothetical protein
MENGSTLEHETGNSSNKKKESASSELSDCLHNQMRNSILQGGVFFLCVNCEGTFLYLEFQLYLFVQFDSGDCRCLQAILVANGRV